MSILKLPVGPGDHVLGPEDAPVTLVEYGDYECPFCGRAHGVVREVLGGMWGDVRFAFRHFPLAQIHPRSVLAAEAAEAAGAQEKFWPMHDTLFENQTALEPEDLLRYAAALELDVTRFAGELESHAHLDRVMKDFRFGVRSGVNGTPTFFINSVRFGGSWERESLATALALAARAARH